jgi:hypothetical protein
MSLEELLEIIQKSKFQSLLSKHHFELVYRKHQKRGGIQDSYSIGFESSNCKLGFHCEATIGAAMISKHSDWDKAGWIDLERVIAYLLKRPIDRSNMEAEHPDRYISYKEKLIYKLSITAESFEPLFDNIVAMFKDEDTISQWKPSLENYIKEDTRRQYNLKK